jgi:hypothetical protein
MQPVNLFLLSLLCTLPLLSQADQSTKNYQHIPGVFIGMTVVDGESNATLGLEYEFKVLDFFGFGVVYEHTPDAHHEDGASVLLLSGYLHPYQGWRLGLGLGQEKIHGDHGYSENLSRFSLAYDFHVAGFGIAPTYNLDRVARETINVYGVAFSKAF